MSVRIGFPDICFSERVADLLAQHAYFGGPLSGLRRSCERLALYRRRACVSAMLHTVEAYRYRAPRRMVRSILAKLRLEGRI